VKCGQKKWRVISLLPLLVLFTLGCYQGVNPFPDGKPIVEEETSVEEEEGLVSPLTLSGQVQVPQNSGGISLSAITVQGLTSPSQFNVKSLTHLSNAPNDTTVQILNSYLQVLDETITMDGTFSLIVDAENYIDPANTSQILMYVRTISGSEENSVTQIQMIIQSLTEEESPTATQALTLPDAVVTTVTPESTAIVLLIYKNSLVNPLDLSIGSHKSEDINLSQVASGEELATTIKIHKINQSLNKEFVNDLVDLMDDLTAGKASSESELFMEAFLYLNTLSGDVSSLIDRNLNTTVSMDITLLKICGVLLEKTPPAGVSKADIVKFSYTGSSSQAKTIIDACSVLAKNLFSNFDAATFTKAQTSVSNFADTVNYVYPKTNVTTLDDSQLNIYMRVVRQGDNVMTKKTSEANAMADLVVKTTNKNKSGQINERTMAIVLKEVASPIMTGQAPNIFSKKDQFLQSFSPIGSLQVIENNITRGLGREVISSRSSINNTTSPVTTPSSLPQSESNPPQEDLFFGDLPDDLSDFFNDSNFQTEQYLEEERYLLAEQDIPLDPQLQIPPPPPANINTRLVNCQQDRVEIPQHGNNEKKDRFNHGPNNKSVFFADNQDCQEALDEFYDIRRPDQALFVGDNSTLTFVDEDFETFDHTTGTATEGFFITEDNFSEDLRVDIPPERIQFEQDFSAQAMSLVMEASFDGVTRFLTENLTQIVANVASVKSDSFLFKNVDRYLTYFMNLLGEMASIKVYELQASYSMNHLSNQWQFVSDEVYNFLVQLLESGQLSSDNLTNEGSDNNGSNESSNSDPNSNSSNQDNNNSNENNNNGSSSDPDPAPPPPPPEVISPPVVVPSAIQISNCTELQNMNENLNADYEITQDIDCNGVDFDPVGPDPDHPFTGSLDGQGYTISNLTVARPGLEQAGLFGVINGTTISHIVLVGASIQGLSVVGVLAGEVANSNISRISSTGEVQATHEAGGGLIGILSENSILSESSSNAQVSVSQNFSGGLVGFLAESVVQDCYSTGYVIANQFAGGLVGSLVSGTINRSYSNSNVGPGVIGVGGLVGHASASEGSFYVNDSFITGAVIDFTDLSIPGAGGSLVSFADGAGMFSNLYWNNHLTNPNQCHNLGDGSCNKIDNNIAYFYDAQNDPLASWDFDAIWQEHADSTPTLRWQTVPTLDSVSSSGCLGDFQQNNSQCLCDADCNGNKTCDLSAFSTLGIGVCANANNGQNNNSGPCSSVPYAFECTCSSHDDCQSGNCVNSQCYYSPEGLCWDGLDNNLDGTVDCDDPTCANDFACSGLGGPLTELNCDDSIDNDLDNDVDCDDADCSNHVNCSTGNNSSSFIDISNCTELQNMNQNLSSSYRLITNIDCNDVLFEPIGFDSFDTFSGELDGDGHTIANLTIVYPTESQVGLFGILDRANIHDLILSNTNVNGLAEVGTLAGSASHSTITRVAVMASSTVEATSNIIGGLVGSNYQSHISRCLSEASVISHGGSLVGGLIGLNVGAGSLPQPVHDNYATGSVSGDSIVGGLIGRHHSGTVDRNYATGNVSTTFGNGGGLIGDVESGSLGSSFATGNVSGPNSGGAIGGTLFPASVTNILWHNHANNPGQCHGGGNANCVSIANANYFYVSNNSPFNNGNWDFTNIWEESADTYPQLRWLNSSGNNSNSNNNGACTFQWDQAEFEGCNCHEDCAISHCSINSNAEEGYLGSCAGGGGAPYTFHRENGENCSNHQICQSGYCDTNLGHCIPHPGVPACDPSTTKFLGGLCSCDDECNTGKCSPQGYCVIGGCGGYCGDNTCDACESEEGDLTTTYCPSDCAANNGNNSNQSCIIGAPIMPEGQLCGCDNDCTSGLTCKNSICSNANNSGNSSGNGSGNNSGGNSNNLPVSSNGDIATCDNLQSMKNDLTADYTLQGDVDCTATATWNNGFGFEPIGTESNPFTGSLDGQGYTISNLTISRALDDYVGLFGYTNNADGIGNVILKEANVMGRDYVGTLVGYAHNTHVQKVSASGSSIGNSNVGGLVGLLRFDPINNPVITTVSNSSSSVATIGDSSIGGLIGRVEGGWEIEDCYTTGDVGGMDTIGGIVGFLDDNIIRSCYSTGAIVGSTHVGGIVGNGQGFAAAVLDSFTVSNVSGSGGAISGADNDGTHDVVVNETYWYNTANNPDVCEQNTNFECYEIIDDLGVDNPENYFMESDHTPIDLWSFGSIWDYVLGDYPILKWQDSNQSNNSGGNNGNGNNSGNNGNNNADPCASLPMGLDCFCFANNECASGNCLNFQCADANIANPCSAIPMGEGCICFGDNECQSSSCVDFQCAP
jgi:hypothetical protein